ncbi:MAG TPA: LytR C-terminal domain-containing protein, partial [Gemmatimonadales bacterium]|nr:LytR C-terminal domain-containing protein [Gemmatimonadales bacterium]
MEQSRRRTLLALALLLLLAAGGGAWALLDRKPVAAPPRARVALADNERVIVEVLNGSRRRGLARVATRELRRAGFDVVYFGTTSETVRQTQALARRGDSAAAARVARALGSNLVRVVTDTLL